jgi:hypothetical protein
LSAKVVVGEVYWFGSPVKVGIVEVGL